MVLLPAEDPGAGFDLLHRGYASEVGDSRGGVCCWVSEVVEVSFDA